MYATLKPSECITYPKCNGSGQFAMANRGTDRFVNPVKHGTCFSCGGTGKHTYADSKRCETYWNKYARM